MKRLWHLVVLLCLAPSLGRPDDRPRVLRLLTPERIALLPEADRGVWSAYLEHSLHRALTERRVLAEECRTAGLEKSHSAPNRSSEFEIDSDTPAEWFAEDENRSLAEVLISYQTPTGGWSKAVDYKKGPRAPGTHWTSQNGEGWHYCGTIDNRTTTEQIKFLAGVHAATEDAAAGAAVLKGIDYLLEAQYPNGGWPQVYPVESGYHEAVTLNDNAMLHVMEVLLDAAEGENFYAFVDEKRRTAARSAVDRSIGWLLSAQVRIQGVPTVWCAQHDPLDFSPVKARAKEPPSLSGGESAEIVKFLMRRGPIRPEVIAAIDSSVKWFEAKRLTGLRKTTNDDGRTDYLPDENSNEVYWARFYDLETGNPIFPGADDGISYPTHTEMAAKNKVAYDFMSTRPRDLLAKELPRWKKRLENGRG
jgi:PelA/Pel-15E family pectate lyase